MSEHFGWITDEGRIFIDSPMDAKNLGNGQFSVSIEEAEAMLRWLTDAIGKAKKITPLFEEICKIRGSKS